MRRINTRAGRLATRVWSAIKRLQARLERDPFDYFLGFVCLVTSFRILTDTDAVPNSIGALPWPFEIAFTTILALAGLTVIVGLEQNDTSHAWRRTGMWLAGTAFVVYGVSAILAGYGANATLSVLVILGVGTACGARAKGLSRESRAHLQILGEASQQKRDRTTDE